jgi:hypothetical protein
MKRLQALSGVLRCNAVWIRAKRLTFRSELKSDDEAILDVNNVEELLAQAKAMDPALSGQKQAIIVQTP